MPEFGDRELQAVERVVTSGQLAQGAEVAALEEEFSVAAVSSRRCVAVNSGTSALHLSMIALGVGPGDEVIVPSFTFAATANSVAMTGATPIFVDIDPVTFCIDPKAVESAISQRTKVIVPVHLYGHPANLTELSRIASAHGLIVVEDAAQAHLAEWDGARVGTWGVAGTFSFYPTKNMTSGEGGMISVAEEGFERSLRLLRNQGQETRYKNEIVGLNNRMSDLHAAIGRVQLEALPSRTQKRQENARFFDENLVGVETPVVDSRATHVYHQYTIRVLGHDRDRFVQELAKRGVGAGVYYPVPVHLLPAFSRNFDLPETLRAAQSVLSIPVYPALSPADREHVVQVVNTVASSGR